MGRRKAKTPEQPRPRRVASPTTTTSKKKLQRIYRAAQLTETEKFQLALRWALLPPYPSGLNAGKKMGVAQLEKRSMVARGYISKHLNIFELLRAKPEDKPLERKERSNKGVPRVWTAEARAALHKQATEWANRFSYEDMELALREAGIEISDTTIFRHLREESWNTKARPRTVPLLTENHRDARLAFALGQLSNDFYSDVDLDEKWWYTLLLGQTLKLPPGATAPLQGCQHKSHIPKRMNLTALARPRFNEDGVCIFDGKIGMWRISEPKEAKRDSRYHKKGDVYEKDVTMNSERYVDLMIETVLPAISAAFRPLDPPVKVVTVQHDGAPPHVGKHAECLIDEFGATLDPPVKIRRQPAQSPDTNICDLAFFRALACLVSKRRRGLATRHAQFDLDQLSADVQQAFEDYDPETLDSMWAYKSEVMQKIVEAKGGNWYNQRRGRTADGKKRAMSH